MKNQDIKISLFYCSNSLSSEEITSLNDRLKNVILSSVSLPCSGKVSLLYLLKAIETGSDGVLMVSCKLGECKYLQGNYRAQKRIEYVDNILNETGLGPGHVKFVSIDETNKIGKILASIEELTEAFGAELQKA